MLFLPDTNVWIHHLNSTSSIVKARLAALTPSQVVLCEVVKAELYYGAFKSARRDANLALLESFFPEFKSLPFDGNSARLCGEIRADLAQKEHPLAPTTYRLPRLHWRMTASWSPITRASFLALRG